MGGCLLHNLLQDHHEFLQGFLCWSLPQQSLNEGVRVEVLLDLNERHAFAVDSFEVAIEDLANRVCGLL